MHGAGGMPAASASSPSLSPTSSSREVDAAVIESAGRQDRLDERRGRAVVCGIASLGFDHRAAGRLRRRSRGKAGIFSDGVPAFTRAGAGGHASAGSARRGGGVSEAVSRRRRAVSGRAGQGSARDPEATRPRTEPRREPLQDLPGEGGRARPGPSWRGRGPERGLRKGPRAVQVAGRGQIERDNVEDGGAENITFYLDGTKESMACCAWY